MHISGGNNMKKISLLICLLTTFSLCACQENSSTLSSDNSGEETSTSEVESATYNLRVDATNTKVEYTTDESFTNEGLLVYLVKTIEDNYTEELTEEYQLYLDGAAINNGDSLSLGSHEITVASTRTDITVRSTNYSINVVSPLVDRTLSEFITWMLEEKNYQVETTITTPTGDAVLNGTIVDNGVLWSEPTDDFDDYDFTTDGYGFSPYQGRTFVWKLDEENNVLTDIFFIDNWINGDDRGWNSKYTRDRWGYLVNNGTIFTITNDELSYLETVSPNEGQGSIYSIDVAHSEWLFTLVGYRLARWNPTESFISGTLSIQVNSDGTMNISGQSTGSGAIYPFTSKIYNVGKTAIPALENFLANPDFQDADTREPLLYFFDQIETNNYVVETNNHNTVHFTENYIYGKNGEYFIGDSLLALNTMEVTADNKHGLESGIYPLINENEGFALSNEKYENIFTLRHLANYREFYQETYFVRDSSEATTYTWTLSEQEDAAYDPTFSLHYLVKWFINPEFDLGNENLGIWSGVEIINKVTLDVTKDTDYVITIYSEDTVLGSFHINSFGNGNILAADELYNSLY